LVEADRWAGALTFARVVVRLRRRRSAPAFALFPPPAAHQPGRGWFTMGARAP